MIPGAWALVSQHRASRALTARRRLLAMTQYEGLSQGAPDPPPGCAGSSDYYGL